MALMAIIRGLGPLFYILWGSRYALDPTLGAQVGITKKSGQETRVTRTGAG